MPVPASQRSIWSGVTPTLFAALSLRICAGGFAQKAQNQTEVMRSVCAALLPFLDERGCLTQAGLRESYRYGSDAHTAIEILLKGPEQRLPEGTHFFDKDGHKREEVRLRWWDQGATTFRKAALGMDGREEELPDSTLPRDFRYRESTPVFFGHYWLSGSPVITAPNAACLDFSVAKEGYLTAYRWSGETQLSGQNLVSVAA